MIMKRTNLPKTDGNGFACMKLVNVEFQTHTRKPQGLKSTGKDEYSTYTFHLECDGTEGDVFVISLLCGDTINNCISDDINRLTTVLLKIGLVHENDLPTLDLDELHEVLLKLDDMDFSAKIIRTKKGFFSIDPLTIR